MVRVILGLVVLSGIGCARLVETRGTSAYAPAGERPGGVVDYPAGQRDDAYRIMSEHCGGTYEIVRESEHVGSSTGLANGAVLVGAVPVFTGLTTTTNQIVKSIEFRCNNTRKAVNVPVVDESSSRAEKLRAEVRRKQADKEAAARQARDPRGFRGLSWGSARTAVEAAFPTAQVDPNTGLLKVLEPVAGFPASTLLGVTAGGLRFVVVRAEEAGSFDAVVGLLTERYGAPDTQSATESAWKFETTVIRVRPDVQGSTIRYESTELAATRSSDL